MSSIVIIGAGECGGRAALQLRTLGFEGSIMLIGEEPHAPYERPPLSKEGLVAGEGPKVIASLSEYADLDIDLRLGLVATKIDRSRKRVQLSDGSDISYDKLLLATGARPRSLTGVPLNSSRILALRTHADALAIKPHLKEFSRIAIIGGGFIGLELAAAARRSGASVTLLEGLPRILSRGVPPEVASAVAERHQAAGVKIICDAKIETVDQQPETVVLRLADGTTVEADLLVVGIGSIPNTTLAEEAGLVIDNGIAVDSHLRTSDDNIFAAGDCCSFPLDVYGGRRVRLESWRSAQEQGMLAATNLTDMGQPLGSVPWFWSDQYDMTLQVAGLADGTATSVRRDMENGAFIVFQLDADNRLLCASGIGVGNAVARDIRLAEMLIASRKVLDPTALASADVRLKSLLAA